MSDTMAEGFLGIGMAVVLVLGGLLAYWDMQAERQCPQHYWPPNKQEQQEETLRRFDRAQRFLERKAEREFESRRREQQPMSRQRKSRGTEI